MVDEMAFLVDHTHTWRNGLGILRPRRQENTMRSNAAMFWKNTRGVWDSEDYKTRQRRSFYTPNSDKAPPMAGRVAGFVDENTHGVIGWGL